MNKAVLLIFVFILLTINVQAWNSKTHELLVENIYYSMPENLQARLNLTELKYGSTAPDLVFHDQVRHHFPPSQERAYLYLKNITDLESFSFNFGVASHYISDSFVSPHYISKEDQKDHTKFENSINYTIKTSCKDYNYTLTGLGIGENNRDGWALWLETKNPAIPQKELEQSQEFLYSIAIQILNYSCNPEIEYEEKPLINPDKNLAYLIILIAIILLILYKLLKYKLSR